ncbi:MAG TPA: hypothetical protein VF085_07265, partial [Solirubrobacterales bacterium]
RAITEIAPGMPKRLRSGENIKSLSLSREPHCRAASLGGPPGARFSLFPRSEGDFLAALTTVAAELLRT